MEGEREGRLALSRLLFFARGGGGGGGRDLSKSQRFSTFLTSTSILRLLWFVLLVVGFGFCFFVLFCFVFCFFYNAFPLKTAERHLFAVNNYRTFSKQDTRQKVKVASSKNKSQSDKFSPRLSRSGRSNLPRDPATIYRQRANQSQR